MRRVRLTLSIALGIVSSFLVTAAAVASDATGPFPK